MEEQASLHAKPALKRLGIRSLYELALAEGEGVGTAYEYYVKRQLLRPWIRRLGTPLRILVAGLPQKYGFSLDFLQLADELRGHLTIVDDRQSALDGMLGGLHRAQSQGWLKAADPSGVLVSDLTTLSGVGERFDLILSSEVLQRLPPGNRPAYVQALLKRAPSIALFVPNADNQSHTVISGLSGISLPALQSLVHEAVGLTAPRGPVPATRFMYLDLPPFPPGVVRTSEQRQRASSGLLEAVAMWGLGYYARLERFVPLRIRRSQGHIVCAIIG